MNHPEMIDTLWKGFIEREEALRQQDIYTDDKK